MSKRMTVIFEDEELYKALKVEAARSGRHAKDIVAEALTEWLEAKEDEELSEGLDEIRAEWREKGGRPWEEVERELSDDADEKEQPAPAPGATRIRESFDSDALENQERKRRALSAIGKFRSGLGDLAEEHDKYLAEDFAE